MLWNYSASAEESTCCVISKHCKDIRHSPSRECQPSEKMVRSKSARPKTPDRNTAIIPAFFEVNPTAGGYDGLAGSGGSFFMERIAPSAFSSRKWLQRQGSRPLPSDFLRNLTLFFWKTRLIFHYSATTQNYSVTTVP